MSLSSEDDAIAAGARYAGLDESHHGYVRAYLRQHPDSWVLCCGAACDLCVLTIQRAVDKARALLGITDYEAS